MKRLLVALLGVGLVAGCSTPGLLYTDITLPLTVDMNHTPRAADASGTSQRSIRAPMSGAGIRAEWSDRPPGESAKIGGLDSVSYADMHRYSVLGGLWASSTVLVYGDRDADTPQAAASGAAPKPARP